MDMTELLNKLQAAHATVKVKAAERDAAANALNDADQAWRTAAENLATLRDEASDLIDALLPRSDPRFRQSA